MKKLRICHFPQIPCEPFIVPVKDLEEAKKILDVLADYDIFQFENKIKPDYCNMTTLEEWDEKEQDWIDYDLDEHYEQIRSI